MRFTHTCLFALSTVLIAGCGSSDDDGVTTPIDSGTDTAVVNDTNGSSDSSTTDAPAADSTSDTSSGGFKLTVQDYLSWCTVAVNGGATATTSTQTVTVPAGTVVNLVGDKASGTFVFGYWVGTAGDTSATHDTAKTTTVKVDHDMVVQACCPFASDPTTPCPAPTSP